MRRLIQTISFKNFASMQYEAEKGSLLIDVFIDEIIKFSNSEENPETVYRVLNYTRFHLCSLSEESHKMTMPKFTSQILLLFSKVLHILEKLLLKNFTGLKVVS